MAVSRHRVRDNPTENVFGVYNADVFLQPLSNFTIQYVFEVRAGGESGFICRVTLFNGDNQGYVVKAAVSQKVRACMACVLSLGDRSRVHINFHKPAALRDIIITHYRYYEGGKLLLQHSGIRAIHRSDRSCMAHCMVT